MSLVQALTLFNQAGNLIRISLQQLQPWVWSTPGQALYRLSGVDVQVNLQGPCTAALIDLMQPLYINIIVIQSQGQVPSTGPYMGCSQLSTDSGWKPFLECCHISGHFNEACRNCKWPDHAAHCSVWDSGSGASGSESSSSLSLNDDDQEEGDQKPDDQLGSDNANQEDEEDFRVWCEYFTQSLPPSLLEIYELKGCTLWVFMMYNDQIVFLIVILWVFRHLAFDVWCLMYSVLMYKSYLFWLVNRESLWPPRRTSPFLW